MTHQAPPSTVRPGDGPGRQVTQLREALRLVEQLAGRSGTEAHGDRQLDEAARVSEAYDRALPIVQRRFDALAAETASWAAAGVEALLIAGADAPSGAAAARLAVRIDAALKELSELVG